MDGAHGSDVLRPVRPEGGGDAGPGSPSAPGPWPPVWPAPSLLSTLEGTVTHCQGPSGSLAWAPPPTPPSISLTTPRERSAPLLPPALDPGQTVPLMATQTCPPEVVLVSRVQTRGSGRLSSGLARVGNVCLSSISPPCPGGSREHVAALCPGTPTGGCRGPRPERWWGVLSANRFSLKSRHGGSEGTPHESPHH